MQSRKVVVVGGLPESVDVVLGRLSTRGYEPVHAASLSAAHEAIASERPHLVLVCLPVEGAAGGEVIEAIHRVDAGLPVVVAGQDGAIQSAADAFQVDAFEYVEDPVEGLPELLAAVGVALGSRRGDVQLRYLREKEAAHANLFDMVGDSDPMRELKRVAAQLCRRTSKGRAPPILVTGETGTGKGLAARCIHYNGARRNKAFVEVNCASTSVDLIESELFGHSADNQGDAPVSTAGYFEMANEGTLFLRQVDALSPDVQAKLITVIDQKRVTPLGGGNSFPVDVQIIASSQQNLSDSVKSGEFRADLYHRLNVVTVQIPPLRARGGDVLLLAYRFLSLMSREYGMPAPTLSQAAESYLLSQRWQGNVRELRNHIERVVLLARGDVIEPTDFEPPRSSIPPSSRPPTMAPPSNRLTVTLPPEGVPLEDVEKEVIRQALDRCDGNVSRAARYLSISRQTLIYRMKKYGMASGRPPPVEAPN